MEELLSQMFREPPFSRWKTSFPVRSFCAFSFLQLIVANFKSAFKMETKIKRATLLFLLPSTLSFLYKSQWLANIEKSMTVLFTWVNSRPVLGCRFCCRDMTKDDGGDFEIDLESVISWHRKPLKKNLVTNTNRLLVTGRTMSFEMLF